MLSEVLNNKIREFQAEEELAMGCACEACGTAVNCSGTVNFTFTTCARGPIAAIGTTVPLEIISQDFRCVREQCFVDVNVPNPCTGGTPANIPCRACLNRYRYIGCLNYIANIPRTGSSVTACFQGCQFIDRIRCYTCADTCLTCPPAGRFIASGPTATITSRTELGGGLFAVTVTVTLTLTSPCPAPDSAETEE